jgi:hypothetical protein
MVRRVFDLLRGDGASTSKRRSDTIFDREVVRRERPRPRPAAAPTAEPAPRPQPPPPLAEPASRPNEERLRLVAALSSRSGLRQAWLLREVLGPPRALHRLR